jgi:hypothetical protein
MRSMRTIGVAATAAIVLAVSSISPASAQRGFGHGFHGGGFHGGGFHGGGFRGGGWHGGWGHRGWGWGPAVAGGLAFGALATAPYYYGYGCGDRVVGYDAYGQPIIADNCY